MSKAFGLLFDWYHPVLPFPSTRKESWGLTVHTHHATIVPGRSLTGFYIESFLHQHEDLVHQCQSLLHMVYGLSKLYRVGGGARPI